MWRNIKADCPEVDLLVSVNAGHDEEQSRALGTASPQSPEPEDDRPLVLLHHLDTHAERHGDGHQEEEEGEGGDDMSTESCLVLGA